MKKRFKLSMLIVTVLICCSLTGIIVYYQLDGAYQDRLTVLEQANNAYEQDEAHLNKFYELMSVIDAYYIGEYDEDTLWDNVDAGLVSGIGDKWSYYLSADDYKDYLLSGANTYVGIGVTISLDERTGGYAIISVADIGPAKDAGFETGDIIIAVDDESVIDYELATVKAMVVGEEGSSVKITLLRDGKQMNLEPVRGIAHYAVVTGEMLKDNVGYVKITNFEGSAYDEFKKEVEALIDGGAQSLVFDVRNNPGGMVSELVPILDMLLPECEVFYSVDYAGVPTLRTSGPDYIDLPFVVLVNEYSFSAAEYFAAILQEYNVADIVGTKTTGKGYYQVPIPLSDGSAVVLSIGKYYTPNRVSLADTGVTPDYEIELDNESFAKLYYSKLDKADDAQLQEAINIAKQRH